MIQTPVEQVEQIAVLIRACAGGFGTELDPKTAAGAAGIVVFWENDDDTAPAGVCTGMNVMEDRGFERDVLVPDTCCLTITKGFGGAVRTGQTGKLAVASE